MRLVHTGLFLLALASGAAQATIPDYAGPQPKPAGNGDAMAVFAGGCFWGVDAVFKHVKGVSNVVSGYSGGNAATAHYLMVGTGTTGHAESVKVTYDPAIVTYAKLLKVFFDVAHDPDATEPPGSRRRDAVPVGDLLRERPSRRRSRSATSLSSTGRRRSRSRSSRRSCRSTKFYPAEDYHQNYLELHPDQPYIVYNDLPKLVHLKKDYPAWYQAKPAE